MRVRLRSRGVGEEVCIFLVLFEERIYCGDVGRSMWTLSRPQTRRRSFVTCELQVEKGWGSGDHAHGREYLLRILPRGSRCRRGWIVSWAKMTELSLVLALTLKPKKNGLSSWVEFGIVCLEDPVLHLEMVGV
jgi:hypothetical protein